jgi:hypothetical protein
VRIEAAAMMTGEVLLGAPVRPPAGRVDGVVDADQQHGRHRAGEDGGLEYVGEPARRFAVGQHAAGQRSLVTGWAVDGHAAWGAEHSAVEQVLFDRAAKGLGGG